MDLGVSDKAYILLGGSGGMGYATARILAAEGAKLTLISRDPERVGGAARTIADEFGVETLGLVADGVAAGELDRAVDASVDRFGAPRGLLVTSGLTDRNRGVLEATDADWDYNFQNVVMGTVRAVRAVLPHMLGAGGGQIVVTSAYSSHVPKGSLFPYASMKSALNNFTRNLAKTYGPRGIRANCIAPGAFSTGRVRDRVDRLMKDHNLSRQEAGAHLMSEVFHMPVALGRPGEPEEIAEMMAFALSERAAYMTGALINVDGGTDF